MENLSLIDEENLFRQVVRRLYSGTVREIVTELLQNSQRAGATRVEVHFPRKTRCVFSDNGHGLVDGVESLQTLLVLAASHVIRVRVSVKSAL